MNRSPLELNKKKIVITSINIFVIENRVTGNTLPASRR